MKNTFFFGRVVALAQAPDQIFATSLEPLPRVLPRAHRDSAATPSVPSLQAALSLDSSAAHEDVPGACAQPGQPHPWVATLHVRSALHAGFSATRTRHSFARFSTLARICPPLSRPRPRRASNEALLDVGCSAVELLAELHPLRIF